MGIKKRRIWCRFWICWKSIKKVRTKKVGGLRTFAHSTKRWKSIYFLHLYVNNFFVWAVLHCFELQEFEISIKFCVFWYPYQNVVKKYLWGYISTFYQLLILTHAKQSKKCKIFFSYVNQNKLYVPILVLDQLGV